MAVPAGDQEQVEQIDIRRLKTRRLMMVPFRWLLGCLLFSIPALGPQNIYTKLPGQVFAFLYLVQLITERALQAPNVGGKSLDRASYLLGWLGYIATCYVSVIEWLWMPGEWKLWSWSNNWLFAGVAMFVLGQGLRAVAIITLGRFFTAYVRVHDGHRVIQHGIYAYLRHPSYTGMILVVLSYVTLFSSFYGYLAFTILFLPGLLNRIKVEERALRKELGQEYRDYCSRVKRLIPFIY